MSAVPSQTAGGSFLLAEPGGFQVSVEGCTYPGELFSDQEILYGPWQSISEWRNAEIVRLKAIE